MTNAQRTLERELERLYPPRIPFAQLERRRERKERSRRIRAGAVGVIVALATGIVLFRSLTSDPIPADQPVEPRPGHVEVIEPGDSGLVAVDPGIGESRTLVERDQIQGGIGNAAWSSVDRWVAYDIHAQRGGLWVANARGEHRRLAEDAGAWAWSPTDAQLAMLHTSESFPDLAEGRVTLSLLDASTGQETDLGKTIGEVTAGPVWSPAGTRIVYGVRGGTIYSVDVEGGDHALLVRLQRNVESIDALEWSPDGAHMAILAAGGLQRRLYVMNADASDLRVLVDDFEPGGWGPGWFPGDPFVQLAWSPDGTRLTYPTFSGPDQRELRIWTASLDGSAPSLVASHTNDECCVDGGDPVWSPDGSQIAFATDSAFGGGAGPTHLVVNADGTGEPSEIDRLTYLSWHGGWYFCRCFG